MEAAAAAWSNRQFSNSNFILSQYIPKFTQDIHYPHIYILMLLCMHQQHPNLACVLLPLRHSNPKRQSKATASPTQTLVSQTEKRILHLSIRKYGRQIIIIIIIIIDSRERASDLIRWTRKRREEFKNIYKKKEQKQKQKDTHTQNKTDPQLRPLRVKTRWPRREKQTNQKKNPQAHNADLKTQRQREKNKKEKTQQPNNNQTKTLSIKKKN